MFFLHNWCILCNYKSIVNIPRSNFHSSLSRYPILFNIKVDSYLKTRGDDVRFPGTVAIAEAIAGDGPNIHIFPPSLAILIPSLSLPLFFFFLFSFELPFLLLFLSN